MQSVVTTESEPIQVIEKLASRDSQEQVQARQKLESGDPKYFEAMLEILDRENRKKPRRFLISCVVLVATVAITLATIDKVLHINIANAFNGMWYILLGVAALFTPTRLQKKVARLVAESDDIRAVGPLAEALEKQDKATQAAAMAALTRLLPRLKHSDTDLLNERQRKFLAEAFGKNESSREFKLAVLQSLPQIGDERFVKPVSRLAEGHGAAKKDFEIRDRATDCLEALKQRIEEDKSRLTLLHPVEAPEAETLLRPAGSATTESDLLLRAASLPKPSSMR